MKYSATKVNFTTLEKKLNRLFKKLDACGSTYRFNVLNEYTKEVPVYSIDEFTQTKIEVDTAFVECVDFELEFDPYKVGDYFVGAVVERTTDDNVNAVYCIDTTTDFSQYRKGQLVCDHCKTRHNRTKVVILVDRNTGEQKMVGRACLHDFTGWNAESFLHYFGNIEEILLKDMMEIRDTEISAYTRIVPVREYLAYCIKETIERGYSKDIKEKALHEMQKSVEIDHKYFDIADTVIKFYEDLVVSDTDDDFWNNTKLVITGKVPVKSFNGIVAYAYTLMGKIKETLRKRSEAKAAREISNHVGNIGDKIEITASISMVGSFQTMYGFTTIYKFVDTTGNVFIWKTSGTIKVVDEHNISHYYSDIKTITIKGTIKEHSEYKGEKQTVLTRCKIIGFVLN